MTVADRESFAVFMLGLGEAYGEAVSDARLEVYFSGLADLILDDIRRAANVHVRTQKFFPRVSELRDAIMGRVEDRAELAWLNLLMLVRRVGYVGVDGRGKPPAFQDETTRRAAMELYGSWHALCERLPSEGPEFLGAAKQFKAAYAAHARREDAAAALPPSRDEAKAVLGSLVTELRKRGLPAPGLVG